MGVLFSLYIVWRLLLCLSTFVWLVRCWNLAVRGVAELEFWFELNLCPGLAIGVLAC